MNENENEVKELTTNHLAMEVLKQEQERNGARNKGLLVGMILLAAVAITVAIAGSVERAHLVKVNYQNDCDWRALLNSYEFVTQDGGGQNYYNSDVGGNVNNGTTGDETKK